MTQDPLELALQALRHIARTGGRVILLEGDVIEMNGAMCAGVADAFLAQIQKDTIGKVSPEYTSQ